MASAALIDVFTVPDLYDDHNDFFVIDLIEYPIIALPYPVSVLS